MVADYVPITLSCSITFCLWWYFVRRPRNLEKRHQRITMQASMELNAQVSEIFKENFGHSPSIEERDAFMEEYWKWKHIQREQEIRTKFEED